MLLMLQILSMHLIIEGLVAGVGGVLVFVPQIFILFFFISLLEDSGYMARVALVMDRIMESVGLKWKGIYSNDDWIWL